MKEQIYLENVKRQTEKTVLKFKFHSFLWEMKINYVGQHTLGLCRSWLSVLKSKRVILYQQFIDDFWLFVSKKRQLSQRHISSQGLSE
jgi:hypothetical protein